MELLIQRAQSGSTVIAASHDADFIHHCDGIIAWSITPRTNSVSQS